MALERQEIKETSFMERTDNSIVSEDFNGNTKEFYLTHVLRHKSPGHIVNVRAKLKMFSQFCFETYSDWPPTKCTLRDDENIIEELLSMPEKKQQKNLIGLLQAFVNWRVDNGINARTIKNEMFAYVGFLKWREVLFPPKYKDKLDFPKIMKEKRHALTLEEIHKVLRLASEKRLALYLAIISSSMREGEALFAKKKDAKIIDGHLFINIRTENVKISSDKDVVISLEATERIRKRFDEIGPEEFIWNPTNSKRKVQVECDYFADLVERVGLGERYENSRTHRITMHRFRDYFKKKASRIDSDLAERFMGHESGKHADSYGNMTPEETVKYYKMIEPEVTVFNLDKVKAEYNRDLLEEHQHVEELQKKSDEHEEMIKQLQAELERKNFKNATLKKARNQSD